MVQIHSTNQLPSKLSTLGFLWKVLLSGRSEFVWGTLPSIDRLASHSSIVDFERMERESYPLSRYSDYDYTLDIERENFEILSSMVKLICTLFFPFLLMCRRCSACPGVRGEGDRLAQMVSK